MNSFQGLYDIRAMKEEDKNFILSTFKRGLYYGDSWFSLIPQDIFMKNYGKVCEELLNRRVVLVACLKEDADVIIGYSITTKDQSTVDWVFVKNMWRKKGIGKSLVPNNFTVVTHLTKLGLSLLSKFPNCIFNPFII